MLIHKNVQVYNLSSLYIQVFLFLKEQQQKQTLRGWIKKINTLIF